MFLYGGAFFSSLIGLFISFSQFFAGIVGSSMAYPVKESLLNLVVNGIVIVTASFLFSYEYKAGKKRLDRLSILSDIRMLPVEYNGRNYQIAELKDAYALLILVATEENIRMILDQLKTISNELEKFIVIPYVVDMSSWQLWKEFQGYKWLAKASNSSSWYAWYLKEMKLVPKNKVCTFQKLFYNDFTTT